MMTDLRINRARWIGLLCAMCVLLCISLTAPALHATVIHSNGHGGGAWSDADTWRGDRVPGANDTVVIAMRDTVVFDRDDREQTSCAALYLDPEAVLTFSEGDHHLTLTVAGPIESYGSIRIDGTGSRRSRFELRLVGNDTEQRTIRLLENAALLFYGHEQHAADRRTVHLTAGSLDPDGDRQAARIIADDDVMFDLQHSRVHDVSIELANLDNAGASANERLNIIGNLFSGLSAVSLNQCDTPSIRDNRFEAKDGAAAKVAIGVYRTLLADIRGNTIDGPYSYGMQVRWDTSGSIQSSDITGSDHGIMVQGEDTTLEDLHISANDVGVYLYHSDAVLKQVVVRDAELAYRLHESSAQLTDCSAPAPVAPAESASESEDEEDAEDAEGDEPPAPRRVLRLEESTARLINTSIEPDQIEREGKTPNNRPYVETMQYVVVRVRAGEAGEETSEDATDEAAFRDEAGLPAGLRVMVSTAEQSGGVPEGKADLNVRNSPVPVSSAGFTPLPASQSALTVRGWRIERNGKLRQAPFYDLIVSAPVQGKEKGNTSSHEPLKQVLIEPGAHWFRPEPNRPEPTVEVTLP